MIRPQSRAARNPGDEVTARDERLSNSGPDCVSIGYVGDRFRRNLAVHQAVDEGRVAAVLRTSIIAPCKAYAPASCLRASRMKARAGTA
jgi:hypothetical protein